MKKELKKVLAEFRREEASCLFVSPHLDDAVFSAGGLIALLGSEGIPVTVMNVFTEPGSIGNSFSAKAFLEQCGYSNARKLFKDRKEEDVAVCKKVGARVVNIGYVDALWREKKMSWLGRSFSKFIPEFGLRYPTFRWHMTTGKIQKEDRELIDALTQKIARFCKKKNVVVFAPVGVGNHVDHLVVRESVRALPQKKYFWEDYPYCLAEENTGAKEGFQVTFQVKPDWQKKELLLKEYHSQYEAIFGSKQPIQVKEVFYEEV